MPAPNRFPIFVIASLFVLAACEARAAGDAVVRLIFTGDIMLDELPGEDIAAGRDPFAGFSEVLAGADIAVGNLECVVATTGEKVEKPFNFRAHPRVLPVLRRHFDAVSLANNHTGDFGHAAFLQQLSLMKAARLPYIGGGKDIREARTPLVIERGGIRIALLAYNDYQPREFEAGPTWPGAAWAVDEQIIADIRAARSQHHSDLVITFMHWGREHEEADRRQKKLARLMIDNGADAVVGSHPHVTQAIEYYKGRLIAYSLGNFVFNGFYYPENNTGWALRLNVTKSGVQSWDTVIARMDKRGAPHIDRETTSPFGTADSTKIGKKKFEG